DRNVTGVQTCALPICPVLTGVDGRTPDQAFAEVQKAVHLLAHRQNQLYIDEILPRLDEEGVHVLRAGQWSDPVRDWMKAYFEERSEERRVGEWSRCVW